VSKLTVTSKLPNSDLAYVADFVNGLLAEEPKPIAGQQGTSIQVRDMFYNNLQRKKTMALNEEYSRIVEVVTRYAIHYPHIKFSCRKVDDKKADVSTHNIPRPPSISDEEEKQQKEQNMLRIDIIKKTYGQNTAGKEFLDFSEHLDYFGYDISGILSKPNSVQSKKSYLLLFINNRLVESDKIKRALDSAY
jgi:DNA mismatch repair protein MLH1